MTQQIRFKEWDGILRRGSYSDGKTALWLESPDGEKIATCTANLNIPLGDGEVFIKNYSENEGMLEALVGAGVVTDTGGHGALDYGTHAVTFPIVKLTNQNQGDDHE